MARILLIDDDSDVRGSVRKMLLATGHEVLEAGDGKAALARLSEGVPDIVLTDIYMPEMDGIELAIRLSQLSPRPKLIAMSGGSWRGASDVLEMATKLGATHTLTKPFTLEQLTAALDEATGKQA